MFKRNSSRSTRKQARTRINTPVTSIFSLHNDENRFRAWPRSDFLFPSTPPIIPIPSPLTNSKNAQRYNLMGQPVGNNYHGIVIQNGKKILVK